MEEWMGGDVFQGQVQELRLVSDAICYGPVPAPDEEVVQQLAIDVSGRVVCEVYRYGQGPPYECARSEVFYLPEAAAQLLGAIAGFFSEDHLPLFVTDVGGWDLALTNRAGQTYRFDGSLGARLEYGGVDLSDLARALLDREDLYMFDGRARTDVVTRITLKHTRPVKQADGGAAWEDEEQLVIDRAQGTLALSRSSGPAHRITHTYEVGWGVINLLNSLDPERLFACVAGAPPVVFEAADSSGSYRLVVDYKNGPQRVREGVFDTYGLPDDYADFAEKLADFLNAYEGSVFVDPHCYQRGRRRPSDDIFCSVIFARGGKHYHYLTDDETIAVGDLVVVPVGRENEEAVVQVVDVAYFSADEAPWPLEKTKRILRKWAAAPPGANR